MFEENVDKALPPTEKSLKYIAWDIKQIAKALQEIVNLMHEMKAKNVR